MEATVVSAVLRTLLPKIFSLLQENHRLQSNLDHDIKYIRGELRLIAAAIEDHDQHSLTSNGAGEVQRLWIEAVRELAYSIEDSIDRFLHRVTGRPDASSLRRIGHRMQTRATRISFAAEIRELRRMSEEISKLRSKYLSADSWSSNPSVASPAVKNSPASFDTDTPPADLVGMEGPLSELLDLIREADEGQPGKLKVISIVGFGGLGKTVLARHAYNRVAVGELYEPRIWVRASEKDARCVVKEILKQVESGMQDHDYDDTSDLSKLITSLRNCLQTKR
ncbi:hypothetical protein PR202_gb12191 [Eleusine coracana subsp. coracana]|uniref:Uncharacterized protein n=1 Tax=Eleusine coracana subsp. coracana TaxID=191504 RepID=A0AAV5ENY2_ELECO|nr:hypothetical protein PR202_gb12191 [Eleusine coracana subsp. coracana]